MRLADVVHAVLLAVGPGRVALIGAVARNAWAPPRATTDLDLTLAAAADCLHAAEAALARLGYRCVRRQQAEPSDALPDLLIFRADDPELRQVDLLVAKTAFEEQVLARAVSVQLGAGSVPVASPEDVVVYQPIADRPRDRDDVRAVLKTQLRAGRSIDWRYLECWTQFWAITDRLAALRAELGA
ncbi:MAG: hypothetical protein HY906_20075 [Deltaproteobacteria bacterium]|nr:hypothetical protein [Deltaproteobacteria bacterium]